MLTNMVTEKLYSIVQTLKQIKKNQIIQLLKWNNEK